MPIANDFTDFDRPSVVLVALQPRVYSEAIGITIAKLRPNLDVKVVNPELLEEEARRHYPRLVLCSQPPEERLEKAGSPQWVEFYPYAEESEVKLRIDGQGSAMEAPDLADLLSMVDVGTTYSPSSVSGGSPLHRQDLDESFTRTRRSKISTVLLVGEELSSSEADCQAAVALCL